MTAHARVAIAMGLLTWLAPSLSADTIYERCPGDLRSPDEKVVASDVIVGWVNTNKEGQIRQLNYYSWDQERKLILDFNDTSWGGCRGNPNREIRVAYSQPADRAKLLAPILASGVRARVTTSRGVKSDYFCLQSEYDFPGVTFLGGRPSDDTFVHLKLSGTGVVRNISFRDLATAVFKGEQVTLTTTAGEQLSGTWEGVTASGHKSRVILRGLDNKGERLATALDDVFQIEFIK